MNQDYAATLLDSLIIIIHNTDRFCSQFSPNYINTLSREKVGRTNKMINKGEMLWSFIKFSQLIL